jgi:cold shock CspA family protein
MGRSQETFNKKEVRKKKDKKKKDKEAKKMARRDNEKSGSLDDMIAYVDENGNFSNTPPDPSKKVEINVEDIELGIPKREDLVDENPVKKGTVTFFNDSKGYGFIKDTTTHESIFVHANNLLEEIKENNLVTYEVEMGQKGPTAVRVKISR